MKMMLLVLAVVSVLAAQPPAQPAPPTVSQVFNQQLGIVEREFVGLAEAMPADKFDFVPTQGEFKGSRTFGQQISHTAAVIYAVAAAVQEEKNPTDMGKDENGPATLKGKDAIVQYLKDAFAYGHKAMAKLTAENLTDMVPSAFGPGKITRVFMANVATWHSFDHYGQAVVYLRMNGIIPPASRPTPKKK
jgi:uncharacterized damage-inducible protein DinB